MKRIYWNICLLIACFSKNSKIAGKEYVAIFWYCKLYPEDAKVKYSQFYNDDPWVDK